MKTAVTLGLCGAAIPVITKVGYMVGGEMYIDFMYRGSVPFGQAVDMLPSITLLIFFSVLRIRQK